MRSQMVGHEHFEDVSEHHGIECRIGVSCFVIGELPGIQDIVSDREQDVI